MEPLGSLQSNDSYSDVSSIFYFFKYQGGYEELIVCYFLLKGILKFNIFFFASVF